VGIFLVGVMLLEDNPKTPPGPTPYSYDYVNAREIWPQDTFHLMQHPYRSNQWVTKEEGRIIKESRTYRANTKKPDTSGQALESHVEDIVDGLLDH